MRSPIVPLSMASHSKENSSEQAAAAVVEMHSCTCNTTGQDTTTGRSSNNREVIYAETRQSQDAGWQLIEDGETADALRHYARAITARARELHQEQGRPEDESSDRVMGDTRSSITTVMPSMGMTMTTADVKTTDISMPLDHLLDKLAITRRNWMVALHRHSTNTSPKCSGKLYGARRSRGDSRVAPRLRNLQAHLCSEESPHVVPADPTQVTIKHAADFCLHCESIVDVELEYTKGGAFAAERRGQCPACKNEQQRQTFVKGHTTAHQYDNQSRRVSEPSLGAVRRISSKRQWITGLQPNKEAERRASAPIVEGQTSNVFRTGLRARAKKEIVRDAGVASGAKVSVPPESSIAGGSKGSTPCPEDFLGGLKPSQSRRIDGGKDEIPATAVRLEWSGRRPEPIWTRESIRARRRERRKRRTLERCAAANLGNDGGGVAAPGNNTIEQPEAHHREPVRSSGHASKCEGVQLGQGIRSGDADWVEEIKTRDEQIRVLKQQLEALGEEPVDEVVTLEEAKKRLREAMDTLMAGNSSAEMEKSLEKWDRYVTNHPDHIEEQAEEGRKWERDHASKNAEALQLMRTFVPPDIFHAGLDGLRGRGLPPALAKRVFDRKVLWLIRAPEGTISRTHVVELKSKFVANDLDVVESRAIHACLPDKFENDADGAKMAWRAGFRMRLQGLLSKEAVGQLKPAEIRRPVYNELVEGPFDPDAACEELETTRSSAFDAVIKPVVAPMEASKISIIGTGLMSRSKKMLRPPTIVTNSPQDSAEGTVAVSGPGTISPASKYRRKSYALSRGQPTANSMKGMISELGSRLSAVNSKNNDMPPSDGCSGEGMELLQGAACLAQTRNASLTEGEEGPSIQEDFSRPKDEGAPESAVPPVVPDSSATPILPLTSRGDLESPQEGSDASGLAEKTPRSAAKNIYSNAPVSMKDIMSELAANAKAREERSESPPPLAAPVTSVQQEKAGVDTRSGAGTKMVSMKDILSELAAKAKTKAPEERSPNPAPPQRMAGSPPPLPPLPPQLLPAGKNVKRDSSGSPKGPVHANFKPDPSRISMKDMMAELAAKARARDERSAAAGAELEPR